MAGVGARGMLLIMVGVHGLTVKKLLRDSVVPTTVSGWRMQMQQQLNASSSQSSRWMQFLYERVCVEIEGEQKHGVVAHRGDENAVYMADGGRKLYYFVVQVASVPHFLEHHTKYSHADVIGFFGACIGLSLIQIMFGIG